MFTKIIALKQHTPIIHFQHDQEGATLRATELKPKLDRFIVNELEIVDSELYEQYKDIITAENFPFDKDNHIVSPYKIVIKGEKKEEFVITSQRDKDVHYGFSRIAITNAPYFADNKNIKDGTTSYKANDGQQIPLKKGIISVNLSIEIKSFDEQILELVEKCLPYVLTYENFGTRQNKGFGSFHLAKFTLQDFKNTLKKHPKHIETLSLSLKSQDFGSIFKKINDEYTILKTGKTFGKNQKEDSQLMLFFEKLKINWEKKIVRDEVVLDKNKKDLTKTTYKYVRALLGLAEEYVYPFDKENGKEQKVKIKCTDKEISRIKSPLTFKVFENTIFVLVNDIEDDVFDATFEFYINDKRKVTIKTPPKYINGVEVFNLKQFLINHMENDWNYA